VTLSGLKSVKIHRRAKKKYVITSKRTTKWVRLEALKKSEESTTFFFFFRLKIRDFFLF
jgi:hypothetical protein